MALSRASKNTR